MNWHIHVPCKSHPRIGSNVLLPGLHLTQLNPWCILQPMDILWIPWWAGTISSVSSLGITDVPRWSLFFGFSASDCRHLWPQFLHVSAAAQPGGATPISLSNDWVFAHFFNWASENVIYVPPETRIVYIHFSIWLCLKMGCTKIPWFK